MGHKVFKYNEQMSDISNTYKNNRIERIYDSSGFDIGRYQLHEDSFLYIDPSGEDCLVRSYTILSGTCRELRTQAVLGSGDLLLINDEAEMTTLYMLEPCTILVHAQCSDSIDSMKRKSADMIQLLADLQTKDQYTKAHSDRVFELAKQMGLALGYHSKQMYNLNKAARFHDVGKVYIPDGILNKVETLTEDEYKLIKDHVQLGKGLVLATYDMDIFEIIMQHHERIDGSGYPLGLIGEAIREEARVLAICDSYDAMTTDRVYKKGKSQAEAIHELSSLAGIIYDKRLVDLLISLL